MFIKKWKEILLFVFPIFVLFFGCFKLIESLIEFSSFKRFERTEIEMENYSERLDSLKKLSEISKAHIFVAWNVDSLKDMVFKENVKIEFLQMEKNSGSGKFFGKFDSLQSLLEDFSWIFPEVVMRTFQMRPRGKIWELQVSFGKMDSFLGIEREEMPSLKNFAHRFERKKKIEPKVEEIKKQNYSKPITNHCSEKFPEILGIIAGHSCLIKTNEEEKFLAQGDSFQNFVLDDIEKNGIWWHCGGKQFWQPVRK